MVVVVIGAKQMSDLVIVSKDASVDVLKSWCFDLPEKEYLEAVRVIEAVNECKAIEKQLKDFEDDVLLEVNRELDSDGKPRFSNQAVREAEVRVRLRSHEGYQKLFSKLIEFYGDRDKAKARGEYFGSMFSVVKNLLYDAQERERLVLQRDFKRDGVKNG